MRYLDDLVVQTAGDEPKYLVCECPEHGLYHFGPTTHLTPGLPPDD